MIVLAAAGVLLAVQAEPAPAQMGRASFLAGMCATLGWETSRERVIAAGAAYDVRNPTADPAGRQAEIVQGIQAAQGDINAVIGAFRADNDVPAFKAAIAERCDSVVRDVPDMLNRTDGTQAAFDAAIANIVTQVIETNRPR